VQIIHSDLCRRKRFRNKRRGFLTIFVRRDTRKTLEVGVGQNHWTTTGWNGWHLSCMARRNSTKRSLAAPYYVRERSALPQQPSQKILYQIWPVKHQKNVRKASKILEIVKSLEKGNVPQESPRAGSPIRQDSSVITQLHAPPPLRWSPALANWPSGRVLAPLKGVSPAILTGGPCTRAFAGPT
jgi:hypothetical protein